ncbi:MAG: hypothetical protein LUD22_00065 [Coprobacillus sp.]|nr:hypothetical protein [Coprobacillus sp.]
MKKGMKLLIMPMCLLLSLTACSGTTDQEEVGETYTVIEDDVETVLETLAALTLDTSNWKGFYYDNRQDEYVDYDNDWILWETIHEDVVLASSEDGFTALYEAVISYLGEELDEWSEYEYFDGTTLYGRYYGESSSYYYPNVSTAYFTWYPQLTIGYAVEQYTDFIGLTKLMEEFGYYFSGSISTSDYGNTKYTAIIDADYTYTEDRETIDVKGTMTLDVIFDEEGNFTELNYNIDMYEYYDDVNYFLTQTLVCHDYLGESFPEPEWVSKYF